MVGVPTAYLTELNDYENGGYLEIPLPREIEEFDGLTDALQQLQRIEKGSDEEKMDAFFLSVVSPERRDLPRYIRVDFEPVGTRYSYRLKTSDSDTAPPYRMTIPEAFRTEAADSPLAGFEESDDVTLEIDTESDHLRIYDPEDYRWRDVELLMAGRKPVPKKLSVAGAVGSLAAVNAEGVGVTYQDQQFRIIPFDANHRVFPGKDHSSGGRTIKPEMVDQVVERGKLPQCSVDELSIHWDEDGEGYREIRRYSETDEIQVRLPEKGSYQLWWTDTSGKVEVSGWVGLDYGRPSEGRTLIGNDWYGRYYRDPADSSEYVIYVPYRSK